MTSPKQPPDGYCAWHPEKGWVPISFKLQSEEAKVQLFHKIALAYLMPEDYHSAVAEDRWGVFSNQAIALAERDGWQIKPVWLSTTPPVSQELVENALRKALFDASRDPYFSIPGSTQDEVVRLFKILVKEILPEKEGE